MARVVETAPPGGAGRYHAACVWQLKPSNRYTRPTKGETMHDHEKTAMAELAFKLGRIIR
jgi:hypothetical protein